MKTICLTKYITALMIFFTQLHLSYAGPSFSGGPSAHPAISTMTIEEPTPGIDFPAGHNTTIKAILALYDGIRIPIYDEVPTLVAPQAGVDYPTDRSEPRWVKFQKVMQFISGPKQLLRLTLQDNVLLWRLYSELVVVVTDIQKIEKAVPGVDFIEDESLSAEQNFFVIVLNSNVRILIY